MYCSLALKNVKFVCLCYILLHLYLTLRLQEKGAGVVLKTFSSVEFKMDLKFETRPLFHPLEAGSQDIIPFRLLIFVNLNAF